MSPNRLSLILLATTLLNGPLLAHAAQPSSSTVLVRNTRQLHVIVDRNFRTSPLYPQLLQTAKRIEHCAEAIHDHAGRRADVPLVRQHLLELNASTTLLGQLIAELPSKTVLQAHQTGYRKTAAVQVTIGKGYVYQATPAYRPQASLDPHDIVRLQQALADVETAAADFACALTAWERAHLWDFGGWDRPGWNNPYRGPVGPRADWGLSDLRDPTLRRE